MPRFDPNAYGCPKAKVKAEQVLAAENKICPSQLVSSHLSTSNGNGLTMVDSAAQLSMPPMAKDDAPAEPYSDLLVPVRTALTSGSISNSTSESLLKSGKAAATSKAATSMCEDCGQEADKTSLKPMGSKSLVVSKEQTQVVSRLGSLTESPLRQSQTAKPMVTSVESRNILRDAESQFSKPLTNAVVATDTNTLPRSKSFRFKSSILDTISSALNQSSVRGKVQASKPLSMDERLTQARAHALKDIHSKQRAKVKGATTSLNDLSLARKPIADTNVSQTADFAMPPVPGSISDIPDNPPTGKAVVTASSQQEKARTSPPPRASSCTDKSRAASAQGSHGAKRKESRARMPRVELQTVEVEFNSSAHGSPILSNASQRTDDSTQPLHSGQAFRHKVMERLHPLAAWDGSMQPPPADWDDRPRFYNDMPEMRDEFNRWIQDVMEMTTETCDVPFKAVTPAELSRKDDQPDGISLVSQYTTVKRGNAKHYGYSENDVDEVIRYAQSLGQKDFEDWGKVDRSRPENANVQDETTQKLVDNWVHHFEQRRQLADAQTQQQILSVQSLLDYQPVPNPNRPNLNIYLRPANRMDAPQMTDIYNWYIENSPRPTETNSIEDDDMIARINDVRLSKLPMAQAVERSKGIPLSEAAADVESTKRDKYSAENGDPLYHPNMAGEKIVGWACASDWTASDYVEHIAAEVEVYVSPAHRRLGVGRCLLDQLLEGCDRGYLKRGGYPFWCAPEYRHLYNSGGGRDLHKLIFVLRKWKYPQKPVKVVSSAKNIKAGRKTETGHFETDYDMWLKNWLESWGFEVEGVLKGVGAKSGRFIDVVHFGRETRWQPAEGHVPNPPAMYLSEQ